LWGGYIGLTAIIFAETGLLVGFFLPGDSLLVTAVLLAATTGVFNVFWLGLPHDGRLILGNTAGCRIGRPPARLFLAKIPAETSKKHLTRAHEFYERLGGKTVIIARSCHDGACPGCGRWDEWTTGIYDLQRRGRRAWIWSMLFIGYFLQVATFRN
jgi:membrane-associated protein